ncbi:hypothetical protein Tco_0316603 [Tanacetum coccineum]
MVNHLSSTLNCLVFTATRWDSLGLAWYLAQRHVENWISGLLAVRTAGRARGTTHVVTRGILTIGYCVGSVQGVSEVQMFQIA